jgi:hypothetical protein
MTRRRSAVLALGMLMPFTTGCGGSAPDAPPHPGRQVTWAEYQKMDAEQKDDPYVLDHLDDEAKKKLAEQQKRRRKR